jgi:hypothetical protein
MDFGALNPPVREYITFRFKKKIFIFYLSKRGRADSGVADSLISDYF